MTVRAKINKCGLEARFDAGDLRLVNVGLGLNTLAVFDVQVVQPLAIDHGNPDLFSLGCVNQHLFHDNIQLATQLGGAEADFASCTCDLALMGETSFRVASRAFRCAVDTACHAFVAA